MADQWKNRIIGHGTVEPSSLLANPLNWRVHPRYQQDALKGTIKDVGYLRSVTVNHRTGFVLDGHLRVALAISTNQQEIPVEYVDVPEELEAEVLATFDPIAALAVAESNILGEVLSKITTSDEAVDHLLATLSKSANTDYEDLVNDDNEDRDAAQTRDNSNNARYPLPIVLDMVSYRRWIKYKESVKLRSDTQAFLKLMDAALDNEDMVD